MGAAEPHSNTSQRSLIAISCYFIRKDRYTIRRWTAFNHLSIASFSKE